MYPGRAVLPLQVRQVRAGLDEGWRRDAQVMGSIGAAHFVSHFFQLALPPLFPVLREEFGVSYIALGVIMTAFYGASGIGQTAAGFLVDRFGARQILLIGMSLLAGGVALAGLSPSYWALVVVAMLAGLGNSVFHPADYAIFNASLAPERLGRAYGIHGICGTLGWAVAPVVVVGLGAAAGWRMALWVVGGLGLLATLALGKATASLVDHRQRAVGRPGSDVPDLASDVRLLLSPPILIAFAYFALLATSLIGIQTFSVSAMVAIYAAPLALATGALTAFLLGSAAGTAVGGVLADHTQRHDRVAAAGMPVAAALTILVSMAVPPLALLPLVLALAGFALGATSPSRDMLVRAATPVSASGKVYGFVYSGLDLGSLFTPLVFGWLLDRGEPRAVFWASAVLMLVTIVTVVQVRRHSLPSAHRIRPQVTHQRVGSRT
jgi:MFS transporter, FSR family, fosmidomycin resistance protein